MTPALLLLAATAAPAPADEAASLSLRVPVLLGDARHLLPRVGVGLGVRLEWLADGLPARAFLTFDHDRFGRTVEIEARTADPAAPPIKLWRSQRLTTSAFLAGLAWVPRWRRVRPRLAVAGGVLLCFYLHPSALPASAARIQAAGRLQAGVEVTVTDRVRVEAAAEHNLVAPVEPDRLDTGGEEERHVLFEAYPAGSLRATYTF